MPSPSFAATKYPPSPRRQPTLSQNQQSGQSFSSSARIQPQAPPPAVSLREAESSHFFDRVKRELDSRETFNEFLKLVNLFTQDIIDTGRLVQDSKIYLGEELMQQWREILGWDDRRDKMWLDMGAGVGEVVTYGGGVLNRPSRAKLTSKYGSYRKLPASVSDLSL
jgi:paired amphipathic helix protein Sin3a